MCNFLNIVVFHLASLCLMMERVRAPYVTNMRILTYQQPICNRTFFDSNFNSLRLDLAWCSFSKWDCIRSSSALSFGSILCGFRLVSLWPPPTTFLFPLFDMLVVIAHCGCCGVDLHTSSIDLSTPQCRLQNYTTTKEQWLNETTLNVLHD